MDWRFSRAFLGNKAAYFALGVASAAIVRDGWARAGGYAAALATALVLGWIEGGAAKLGVPLAWTACLWLQTRAPGALPARLLSSRPMLWLGGVSYPLYLVNEPIQRALGWWIAGAEAWVFAAVWLPGATLGPIAAAAALAAWVERPAWRAGRAWAAGFANRDRRSARHGL